MFLAVAREHGSGVSLRHQLGQQVAADETGAAEDRDATGVHGCAPCARIVAALLAGAGAALVAAGAACPASPAAEGQATCLRGGSTAAGYAVPIAGMRCKIGSASPCSRQSYIVANESTRATYSRVS